MTNLRTAESDALFDRARRFIPGGVNSPVRAFRAVGGTPRFIARADGPWLYDEDDNRYLDCYNSWGPMILGYNHPEVVAALHEQLARGTSYGAPTRLEVEIAELVVSAVPSIDVLRMVNSGTEATMSALRLARGATGRDLLIKFEGCYHGHGDAFLSKAGSGMATLGLPSSPGVPQGAAKSTLNARYNDLDSVRAHFEAHPGQIAGVIVEPVAGNMGCVLPEDGFLEGLRQLCDFHGALLIFDEVMTGFRLGFGGAQTHFAVMPDLTTLGKIIGGGLPVGAYGGREDLMRHIAPDGPVYQAGTLSGNPLGMAAGLATLRHLEARPGLYDALADRVVAYRAAVDAFIAERGYPVVTSSIGSMITLFFRGEPVRDYDDAAQCDTAAFGRFFHAMLDRGVHLPPAQFESWFLSAALGDEEWALLESATCESLEEVFSQA